MKSDKDSVVLNKLPNNGEINERQFIGDEEENKKLMDKTEPSSPMKDIDQALEVCTFGRFHYRLMITTVTGFVASILVSNSTSFILPIAECDLDMNLKQKGLLNGMPFIGIFVSTVLSGFLIDTFGRILFIRIGYIGLLGFSLVSACSQTFTVFAAAKFGEGFFSGMANTGVMSFVAEFCYPTVRDRMMLLLAAVGAMTQIIAPAMAWAILIHNWEWSLFDGAFVLKTWNFYLLAMSLWSLVTCAMYTSLPETPKFLITQKKYLEARNVLISVYKENTGKGAETFPYLNLWDQEIKDETKSEATQKPNLQKFKTQLVGGLRNMKPLLHRPYITYLMILGGMQFIIVLIYDVLRLWFPQLSTIVEHYNFDGNRYLCAVLDEYTAAEKLRIGTLTTTNVTVECVPQISGTETYVNSLIVGIVCLVPYFISGVLINKVGKKCLLILAGVISVGNLFGIRYSSTKTMMVAFFSIDIAITQTMKGLIQVILVEVFPTTTRSLAMALVIVISRGGTLVGNIGFPILLDLGCEIPFYAMIVMMICQLVMAIFTPKKKET